MPPHSAPSILKSRKHVKRVSGCRLAGDPDHISERLLCARLSHVLKYKRVDSCRTQGSIRPSAPWTSGHHESCSRPFLGDFVHPWPPLQPASCLSRGGDHSLVVCTLLLPFTEEETEAQRSRLCVQGCGAKSMWMAVLNFSGQGPHSLMALGPQASRSSWRGESRSPRERFEGRSRCPESKVGQQL